LYHTFLRSFFCSPKNFPAVKRAANWLEMKDLAKRGIRTPDF
jgi:hypothetical protein